MFKNHKTLYSIFTLCLVLITNGYNAQVSHGGNPIHWNNKQEIPLNKTILPAVDVSALLSEDLITEKHKDIPFRFGYAHQVNYTLLNSGSWKNTKHGKVWRLRVQSTNAFSINVTFSKFKLINGAKLFIYNADKTYFIGSFTSENNKLNKKLGTTPIPGDDIIIELYEPNNSFQNSQIEIKAIAHDYKGIFNKIFKSYGSSGSCNINTSCSQGYGWNDEISSVALITLSDGTRMCTGALVNNTSQNGTPYFLTANHCLDNTVGTWVFIFGYESSVCSPNQDGLLTKSISGSTLRASNANSDFGLLELSTTPPSSYNIYYNGWDNSDIVTSNQTGIHHPSGDVKKISIDNDPTSKLNFSGTESWEIGSWDQGTTEGGSSGSPLFDQNKRVIGQLLGGSAACGNNGQDYYGRFGISWNGTSASTRLKDWLDPNNTGVSSINGYNPNISQLPNDVSINSITGISNSICDNNVNVAFDIFNGGTNTISSFTYTIKLNSTAIATNTWNGSLTSGQSTNINHGAINVVNGSNSLEVIITNPNGTTDPNIINNNTTKNFNVINPSANVDIIITLDDYGSETTWLIKNSNGATLYTGGPYADYLSGNLVNETVCLGNGCYDFIINDAADDGICCSYGNGSYTLDLFSSNLANSNGQFNTQETKSFCITSAGIEEAKLNNIVIFPNPANTEVTLKHQENNSLNRIVLYNILGEKVFGQSKIESTELTIDLSQFTAGTYTLKLISKDSKNISKKIFIVR